VRRGAGAAGASVADVVSFVSERASDRVFTTSERVGSAAEGAALLASRERAESVADRVQRVVVLTVPVVRMAARGARFTRIPWVLVSSAVVSTVLTVGTGARELQVVGSLIAHRIETATGQPADPSLVKKLAVELYLAPKRLPDVSHRRSRLARLMSRWLVRGAIGRDTGKAAMKALEAAERLDIRPLTARWSESEGRSSRPAGPEESRPVDLDDTR
jgi:hypothetical protein